MPTDVKWLTEEEDVLWQDCQRILGQDTQPLPESAEGVVASLTLDALKSLIKERQQNAECRRLMEKHEWVWANDEKTVKYCPECGRRYVLSFIDEYPQETWEHCPDCLWAKAIGKGE